MNTHLASYVLKRNRCPCHYKMSLFTLGEFFALKSTCLTLILPSRHFFDWCSNNACFPNILLSVSLHMSLPLNWAIYPRSQPMMAPRPKPPSGFVNKCCWNMAKSTYLRNVYELFLAPPSAFIVHVDHKMSTR